MKDEIRTRELLMEREMLGEREEGEWDYRKEETAGGEKEVGNVGGVRNLGLL